MDIDDFVRMLRATTSPEAIETAVAEVIGVELTNIGKGEIELRMLGKSVLEYYTRCSELEQIGEETPSLESYLKMQHPWLAKFIKQVKR